MNIKTLIILALVCAVSLFLNVTKKDSVPACMNADEAAFGYNSYSLLKTGKDEYGISLPLRLKSFGDYKMPLYSYLSVPFTATIGLNETGTRALNTILAILFPVVMFYLSRELFKNNSTALLASFLTAASLGLAVIGRQAHEAYLSAILMALSTTFFLRWYRTRSRATFGLLICSILFLLFSYQSARIFAAFFVVFTLYETIRKRFPVKYFVLFTCIMVIFSVPDIIYKPARVGNLLFFKNPGLGLKTQELRQEGGSKILYNKVTVGAIQFVGQHLLYYSPQFLATRGDENFRFGFSDMPPLTYVEYAFFLIGIYFLIRKKEITRYFLLWLLLVTPLAGSLSWAGASITRTLFLIPLITLIASYGFIEFLKTVPKKNRTYASGIAGILFFILLFYSWNFYLNHYNKRAAVIVAQQCGYKELAHIIRQNYKNTNTFYISKERGEPYILLLYYLGYDPAKYQKQANLSAPDIYGFGQVEQFDKFKFSLPDNVQPGSIIVGTPEDFKSHGQYNLNKQNLQIIRIGIKEMFWIYKT